MLLKFDARLYSRKSVEAAMDAYRDLGEFRLKEDAGWLSVDISRPVAELDQECGGDFAGEFSNHVLSETKR